MNKLIGIFILVIGLIASTIEIYSFIGETYPWIFQADDNIPLTNEVTQNTVDSQSDNKDEHASTARSVQIHPLPLAQWKQLQAMEKHQTEKINEPTCQHDKDCQSLRYDNLPISPPLDPKSQTVFEHWKQQTQMIEKDDEE